MDWKEALTEIQEDGIRLGAGDYVSVEALKIAALALEKQIFQRELSAVGKCEGCRNHLFCMSVAKAKEESFEIFVNKKNCKKTVVTNGDRIRSMSDLELAIEIENSQSGITIKNPKNIDYLECILEWLNQPYKGDKNETD